MSFKVKIAIPSDTKYLSFLRKFLSAITEKASSKKITEKNKFFCALALVEAVDNAIFHAHSHQKKLLVDISITVNKEKIVISVSDNGRGLKKHLVENAPLTAVTGRGLYLIKKLMTKVESRISSNKHTLVMTYNLC